MEDCVCESSISNINDGPFGDMVGESSSGETDILDVSVDFNLVIADVVSVFGRFVKYAVGQAEVVSHWVEFMWFIWSVLYIVSHDYDNFVSVLCHSPEASTGLRFITLYVEMHGICLKWSLVLEVWEQL